MRAIKLNTQETYVWIAATTGWTKKAGFLLDVEGIPCTVVPELRLDGSACLIYSELESGSSIAKVHVPLHEILLEGETKVGTLTIFAENAIYALENINKYGKEYVLKKARRYKFEYEKKFGPKPKSQMFEFDTK